MSKLQQDFWHPLFYFIHKDGLSTYDTTATPSDALPHNTPDRIGCRTEMNLPQRCITRRALQRQTFLYFSHFSFFTNVLTEAIKVLFTGREGFP